MRTGAMHYYSPVGWSEGMPLDYAPDSSRLWFGFHDVLTEKGSLRQPQTPSDDLPTVHALRDGMRLITSDRVGTLCLWDLRTRQCLWRRQADDKFLIKYIAVSSTLALTTNAHGRSHLYRLRDGVEIHAFDKTLKLFLSSIKTFSQDGTMLAGESSSGGLLLLDLRTGSIALPLGTDRDLKALRFGPQDKTLIAVFSGAVRVWDWRINRVQIAFNVNRTGLESSAISPDGRYAATCTTEGEAIWDLHAPSEPRVLSVSAIALWHVRYSPDGRELAAGGEDGSVYRYEAATGRRLPPLQGNGKPVIATAYSHDGRWIAAARADGTVWIWNARTGQKVAAFTAHTQAVDDICFSRDSRTLITSGDDHVAKVWDIASDADGGMQGKIRTCKERLTLRGHVKEVESVALSPDETQILTGSEDKTAKLWKMRTGKLLTTFSLQGETWSVAFSPDGRRAAFALLNNTVEIWDIVAHRLIQVLQGHTNWVVAVAFSRDGRRIVTGGRDSTARVWDVESGRELLTLKGHQRQVIGVAFSPDGNQIATSSQDGTLRLWNAAPLPDTPAL